MLKKILFIGFTLFLSCQKTERDAELKIEDRILDNVNVLTEQQKKSLFRLVEDIDRKEGPQIAIVTIQTLGGQKIEKFSFMMAKRLRLGREEAMDGLLITCAIKDKEIRIEVGIGLERIIKDEVANRIIREEMIPLFIQGKYFEGLLAAIYKIKSLIEANKNLIGPSH